MAKELFVLYPPASIEVEFILRNGGLTWRMTKAGKNHFDGMTPVQRGNAFLATNPGYGSVGGILVSTSEGDGKLVGLPGNQYWAESYEIEIPGEH